jgi:ascorbate-specific PTS system EIIC-type component UlaA
MSGAPLELAYEESKTNNDLESKETKSNDNDLSSDESESESTDIPKLQVQSESNGDKTDVSEKFTMLSDSNNMNSILVFGLFVILFLFVYLYGFHGILKFEKNLNYLIAILFSGFGIILSIILIISTFKYISNNTMTEEEKQSSRNALLVMIVLVIFFSMMAFIRYNYAKLFNALNKTLPANNSLKVKKGK